MKAILTSTIILFCSICYSQDAPIRIGEYVIGETHISAITQNSSFGVQIISNKEDYTDKLVKPGEAQLTSFKICYELLENQNDTGYYSLVAPYIDNYRNFIFPQLYISGHVLNNVLLSFYKDTLVRFEYGASADLMDVMLAKYKGKGTLLEKKESISKCKDKYKGKRFTEHLKRIMLTDESTHSVCELAIKFGIGYDCEFYNYISIKSFKIKEYQSVLDQIGKYIKDKKKSLIAKAVEAKKQAAIEAENRKKETLKNF